jgi:hypothetical protein
VAKVAQEEVSASGCFTSATNKHEVGELKDIREGTSWISINPAVRKELKHLIIWQQFRKIMQ